MSRHSRRAPLVVALLLALVVSFVGSAGPATARVAADAPTGSISGHVTVPAGVDVTDVTVLAWRHDSNWGLTNTATVAADGTYTIGTLPAGAYWIEFMGLPAGLIREYWPNAMHDAEVMAVTVGTGPVTGIDAALDMGGTVSGTVFTNSDCDLTKVEVYFIGTQGQTTPSGVVLADGRWSVRGLPTGNYLIEFEGRYAGLPREFPPGHGLRDRGDGLAVTAGQTITGLNMTLNGPTTGCVAIRPYVVQVYADLLHRYPDGMGLNTWSELLKNGSPYTEVANALTASDEYRSKLIIATYATYLNRSPEPAGLTFWLAQMRAGRQLEDIQAGFIASDEYYLRYGSTPAGWVTGLYQTVLGRSPSPDEVTWWVSHMAAGMSRAAVARGFLYSTEHLSTVVDGYYVDLLRRHLDPNGQATWVGLIQRGHRDEEIIASIISSQEYFIGMRTWRTADQQLAG